MEKFSPFHNSPSPSVTESDSESDHRCTRSDEDVGTYIDRYNINPADISQILANDAGIRVSFLEGQVHTRVKILQHCKRQIDQVRSAYGNAVCVF